MKRQSGQAERESLQIEAEEIDSTTAPDHTEEPPLGIALFRVSRAIYFEDKPVAELHALPFAQLRLLWIIGFSPDSTMKDFSERLGVSQSTVTQLADRLVRRNYVERIADPNDRRVIRLRVSDIGKEILDRANEQRHRTLYEVWKKLKPKQRNEVMKSLDVLARAAEDVHKAAGRPLTDWQSSDCTKDKTKLDSLQSVQSQPVVDLITRRARVN